MRPVCLNIGCNSLVANSGVRYRPLCSNCHKAGYYDAQLKEKVKPFKTGMCSNQNERLGFKCPMSYKKAPWAKAFSFTDLDHIDGNNMNHNPKNIQELCKACHMRKSMANGDLKKQTGHVKHSEHTYTYA